MLVILELVILSRTGRHRGTGHRSSACHTCSGHSSSARHRSTSNNSTGHFSSDCHTSHTGQEEAKGNKLEYKSKSSQPRIENLE